MAWLWRCAGSRKAVYWMCGCLDRKVALADAFIATWRICFALSKGGGAKGSGAKGRRVVDKPVRAAQPLRPSPLPSTLEMPC